MPPPGIEPATPCFLACPSNHSAIGKNIDKLLEHLQYFLIKRYYKNYVSCARDIYKIKMNEHCSLTVLWLIPFNYKMNYTKEEFFTSYMSMTKYDIYSFLFIIVYIVCIIIYLLILYVHVALYITHLLDTGASSHTVNAAVYSIKWAHEISAIRQTMLSLNQSKSPLKGSLENPLRGRILWTLAFCSSFAVPMRTMQTYWRYEMSPWFWLHLQVFSDLMNSVIYNAKTLLFMTIILLWKFLNAKMISTDRETKFW